MKIVMVGDFPPCMGGISSHIYSLSKQLIKEGHEVFVITYSHENLKNIDGIQVIGAKIINKSLIRPFMFKINAKRKLEEIIKKEDINIIHGHFLYPAGAVATEIGKKYNIPTYVTAHGGDIYKLYKKHPLLKKPIEKVLNNTDHILAVSNKLLDQLRKTNIENIEKKLSLHLNAVNTDKFKPITIKNKKEKPTVIFVGRLEKQKNLSTLLDAKKHSKTDYELVIMGDGSQKDKLIKKVKNNKIKDVKFIEYREDVEKILPYADLFVLPSFIEGLSIALIEALACGLPVIGSDIEGMDEVINTDIGLLIDPYDYKSLSNAIDKVLTDENLYKKFRSNARKKAMEFSQMKIPYSELK